jgi:hypothetical protein
MIDDWRACASLFVMLAGRYVREELAHFGVDAVDIEFELFGAHFEWCSGLDGQCCVCDEREDVGGKLLVTRKRSVDEIR